MHQEPPRLRALPGTPSLEDLLAKVAGGDQEAFALIYDRLAAPVYGLALRLLRDPAQSEEVAQEIFFEVWRQAPRYDPNLGTAFSWIMTIAHRRAVDRIRSEQAARDRIRRAAHVKPPPPFDAVVEGVEQQAEQRQVRAALEQLTRLQRQAIELAYYGGHAYREVAELLDAPLGTIKTRMRDGLQRLRALLEDVE